MRPAFRFVAPLLMLPFLACTDTPAEPETQETAVLKKGEPVEPGDYIVAAIKCQGSKGSYYSFFWTGDFVGHGTVACDESSWPYPDPSRIDWAPIADGSSYFVWQLHIAGGTCAEGENSLNQLPLTRVCPDPLHKNPYFSVTFDHVTIE